MAATTKNILIFGSTGLIGRHITRAIIQDKQNFGKIGVFTSPNTIWTKGDEIAQLKSEGVEVIAGDINSATDINEAYEGFDTIISCVGRPIIQTQLQLIELAEKHPDIKRFFPSEYGTDIEYSKSSANEKPHQKKLEVRSLLSTVKNLEYTYVVTGPYGDADNGLYLSAKNSLDEEGGSFSVARKRAVLLGDGKDKISLTTMRDVGKLLVAALLHPGPVRNSPIHVNSFTTTPDEIVAEFERQTGERWNVAYTSLSRLKEVEEAAWAEGDPTAGGLTLKRIWTSGGTLYKSRDNHLVGMENSVDSLQDAIQQAIIVQGQAAT